MRPYARVYVDINLDAVIHNMEAMQQNLTPGTGMIGVVKTDAYGHGAVQIAQTIEPYVWGYAVASVEEAMIL
ncbi:MAG: alanine racemase, partial [Hungatella sp.]